MGLANGIEIVTGLTSQRPDPLGAATLKNAMRERGVLVGTTGRAENVLKVRPPLAFTAEDVPLFVAALTAALDELPPPNPR